MGVVVGKEDESERQLAYWHQQQVVEQQDAGCSPACLAPISCVCILRSFSVPCAGKGAKVGAVA